MASPDMDSDDDYTQLPPEEEEDDDDYFELPSISNELLHEVRLYSLAELQELGLGAIPAVTHTVHVPHLGATGRGDDDPAPPVAAATEALKTVEAPSDGRDCPICLDAKAATGAWTETRCGHSFHGRCVERWLQAEGSCPMCRHQLMLPPAAAAQQHLAWMDILEIYSDSIDFNFVEFPQ